MNALGEIWANSDRFSLRGMSGDRTAFPIVPMQVINHYYRNRAPGASLPPRNRLVMHFFTYRRSLKDGTCMYGIARTVVG